MFFFTYNRILLKDCAALFAVLFFANFCFGQTPVTKYKITGHTSQIEGKARLLLYTNQNQFIPYDSVAIKNGTFMFSGTLDEPKSFQLLFGDKGRILFVGNERIIVNKDTKDGAVVVSGSKLSDDYDYYFNRWIAPLIIQSEAIDKKINALDATHQKEMDSLTQMQSVLFNHVSDSAAVFIRQKPSSFVSLYLLNYYIDSYTIDTIENLFNHLDTQLKEYPSALFIKKKIKTVRAKNSFAVRINEANDIAFLHREPF